MAGMVHFELVIKGRGGHTAAPQHAVDPVLAAAAVIQGVQSLQTREVDALKEPTVVMFGEVHGGSASNVIPESVTLSGTMRYLFQGPDDGPDNPKARFERIVAGICHAHRAEYELRFLFGHPALVNHPGMVDLVCGEVCGRCTPAPEIEPVVTLAGEDFSEFAARAPSVFCFVGAGKPGVDRPPHHHPRFDLDEAALKVGVEVYVRSALAFFEKADQLPFLGKGGA
jgi:amidohydrolase